MQEMFLVSFTKLIHIYVLNFSTVSSISLHYGTFKTQRTKYIMGCLRQTGQQTLTVKKRRFQNKLCRPYHIYPHIRRELTQNHHLKNAGSPYNHAEC